MSSGWTGMSAETLSKRSPARTFLRLGWSGLSAGSPTRQCGRCRDGRVS